MYKRGFAFLLFALLVCLASAGPATAGDPDVLAWVYVYNLPADGLKSIESGDYLNP